MMREKDVKKSEGEIRDWVMKNILYERIGKEGSWDASKKKARFDLKTDFRGYKCSAEGYLAYNLPSIDNVGHNSDILIYNEEKCRYVSIEIKYESNVTDAFKCRSYDMIQLKRTYREKLLGVMVYIKPEKGGGVRNPELARAYCHPFDPHFYCIPEGSKDNSPDWDKLISAIEKFLKS